MAKSVPALKGRKKPWSPRGCGHKGGWRKPAPRPLSMAEEDAVGRAGQCRGGESRWSAHRGCLSGEWRCLSMGDQWESRFINQGSRGRNRRLTQIDAD